MSDQAENKFAAGDLVCIHQGSLVSLTGVLLDIYYFSALYGQAWRVLVPATEENGVPGIYSVFEGSMTRLQG